MNAALGAGALGQLRRLWDHAAWADAALLAALETHADPPASALREYAHLLGAEEVWLSRLECRPARAAVWPELSPAEARELARAVGTGYAAYLSALTDADLSRDIAYTNSAGLAFTTAVGDILLHVALHGQYHRGRVNLLLRQADLAPAPVDFIGFVRGVPAATMATP
jgi:uncharacterized damage-inducible protein DinB